MTGKERKGVLGSEKDKTGGEASGKQSGARKGKLIRAQERVGVGKRAGVKHEAKGQGLCRGFVVKPIHARSRFPPHPQRRLQGRVLVALRLIGDRRDVSSRTSYMQDDTERPPDTPRHPQQPLELA